MRNQVRGTHPTLAFRNRFCWSAMKFYWAVPVPMEDMDLVVSPSRREVTVAPLSPNIPHARVK